jgi:DNA (cytosine-5)-methyltransferase 1
MKKLKVGSDFSGVGAFDQALRRLEIDYKTVFSCDMDKYARQTYIENYGEPEYYPENVYNRKIPDESLDIFMTSPPCQSFSLAGKRKGEDSINGILFYNSHEFIVKNKPRYFIFENVKGLLSDNKGRTFQTWIDMLGGKSVNGNPVLFPREDSTPYHIYYKVLNAKKYGVPQNRERVFIVGIRDDQDNKFTWPKEQVLTKRLKDVLEPEVDEKYYLSDKMLEYLVNTNFNQDKALIQLTNTCDTLTSNGGVKCIKEGYINQDTQASQVYSENGTSPNVCAGTHGYANGYVKVKSATKQGFETATAGDSINFSQPSSQTRRGRVGKGVAQTLDTACNQGIIEIGNATHSQQRIYSKEGISPTISAGSNGGGQNPCKHLTNEQKIRRLTPRECFRLMDFPESFKWSVSDTQAYKQAGNSIVVNVLAEIIKKLQL